MKHQISQELQVYFHRVAAVLRAGPDPTPPAGEDSCPSFLSATLSQDLAAVLHPASVLPAGGDLMRRLHCRHPFEPFVLGIGLGDTTSVGASLVMDTLLTVLLFSSVLPGAQRDQRASMLTSYPHHQLVKYHKTPHHVRPWLLGSVLRAGHEHNSPAAELIKSLPSL